MGGALILIVEDNEKNLKLVRDVLEFAGYETLAAGSAEDAVPLASARTPELILMDLQLPGMDGISALRHLRSDDKTSHIPVVALTAYAMPEDRRRVLEAGFDGYLEKPINVRDFPGQISEFMSTGRQERVR